jgi:hypothetical protein
MNELYRAGFAVLTSRGVLLLDSNVAVPVTTSILPRTVNNGHTAEPKTALRGSRFLSGINTSSLPNATEIGKVGI